MKTSKALCAMGMILMIAMSAVAQDRHAKSGCAHVNGLKMKKLEIAKLKEGT